MPNFRRPGPALVLAVVALVSVAAAPAMLNAAGELYTRLEILSRIFEYIDMYYVDETDPEELFGLAVNGLLDNLDPHSRYYTAEEYRELSERYRGDYHGIGIQFEMFGDPPVLTVIDVLEGGPSEALGLRPGDQIVGINGDDAVGLTVDEVYDKLRGPKGTEVDVTVARPSLDGMLDFTITRDRVEVPAVAVATMLTPETGYVWLNTFSRKATDQLEQHLREFERQGMSNFILDLRGNRGGLMDQARRVTDKFIGGGKKIVYTKGRTPNANGEIVSTQSETHARYPVIVLVDHGSASASEIVAGALQDWDRALIVGQTTFGKALVQNQFPFRDGSALFLTIARYYTPSGRLIQRPYEGENGDDYMHPDWEEIEEVAASVDPLAGQPEGAAADVEADRESRPVYHTAGGRVVYGGGGILPDVVVEPTTVSRLAVWLYGRRLGFQFAMNWVASHAAELPPTLDAFVRDFELPDDVVDDFIAFLDRPDMRELLEQADVPMDAETLQQAREDMRMYLMVDIAANLWGQEAGRIVLLQFDRQIREALKLVPQAAELLKLNGDERKVS